MKKAKIVITFDNHNLANAKMKNITKEQAFQASMLLSKYSRRVEVKKTNKLIRFIKRLIKVKKRKIQQLRQPYFSPFIEV